MSYITLPNMIIHDCCFALKHLVNEEAFDLVRELEKTMKDTGLELWEIIDKIYSGLIVNEKDSEPSIFPKVMKEIKKSCTEYGEINKI